MVSVGDLLNGKYRLLRLVGDGGMGSVYEAQHEALSTRVAIKVLHPELARRQGLVDRFMQEARVSARVRSPHVVNVIDVDRTASGDAYIVMELLEGEPLATVIDRDGKLPVATACDYTIQILDALEAAHELGVIHRDLKPDNVFVTRVAGKPLLKLIDFGIAKLRREDGGRNLTVAGVLMGTAEYMAPEQARSADRVDARADLYAVGVMLYEMLSGARPASGEDARIVALKVERGEVTPLLQVAPHVPQKLAGLVHRAMAPMPELRFASAAEMRSALQVASTATIAPHVVVPSAPGVDQGGTMRGTPAEAAFGQAATKLDGRVPDAPSFPYDEPKVPTVRVPPMMNASSPAATAYGDAYGPPLGHAHVTAGGPFPGAMGPGGAPQYRPPQSPRRGFNVLWLIVIPVLLGVGLVVALVVASSESETPPPLGTGVSTNTGSDGASAIPSIRPPSSGALPSLDPASPQPTLQQPGTPPIHPTGIPSVSPHIPLPDGGVVLPSSLPASPPFPTFNFGDAGGFPLPSGFPSALPSGFPSVLPFPFPPFPPAPARSN